MSLYVDSSAFLKRYLDEPDSDSVERNMKADTAWITARHTWVEVRRNLARLVSGSSLTIARQQFVQDWQRTHIVEIDERTCLLAADIAELAGVRTLDALHLAALQRVGTQGMSLLTFDIRQAQAARSMGITVLGT